MVLSELEDLKNEALEKMRDASLVSNFLEGGTPIKELWSKGPSISIVPYELEMAGVTPSQLSTKEPSSKKNVYRHLYNNNGLQKIEIYNAKGQVHEAEMYSYVGTRIYSLKTNRHAENIWIKIAELDQGNVMRACRVDFDSEFWTFGYQWRDGVLQEILSFSSNSVPGIRIYPEYSEGNGLAGMYFVKDDTKIYVYRR